MLSLAAARHGVRVYCVARAVWIDYTLLDNQLQRPCPTAGLIFAQILRASVDTVGQNPRLWDARPALAGSLKSRRWPLLSRSRAHQDANEPNGSVCVSWIKRISRKAFLRSCCTHQARSSNAAGSKIKLRTCVLKRDATTPLFCLEQPLAHCRTVQQIGGLAFRHNFLPHVNGKRASLGSGSAQTGQGECSTLRR